ncbi:MAG TPA: glycerophosphodiester phosphodiesterase [Microthrixaceae bacterium]|nr:glycerophosphodiester phosphodiesterase [Microthrixaceae bacterium]
MTSVTPRPLVIAHRGASHDHPENTVDAFVAARRMGADGVELDVRRSRDGVLVVHHDPSLGDGRIIADLDEADLPDSVPTLRAALEACSPLLVNVEIKNFAHEPGFEPDRAIAKDTLAVVAEVGSEVLISSFDIDTIDACRAADPTVPTGYLVYSAVEPVDAIGVVVERGHRALHPWHGLVDEAVVIGCREAGLVLNTWTVDDPDRIAQLGSWRVDGIVTNRPDVALGVLA